MAQPHVTKTLGPIHFEDLDPHRFEDLVRQLIYDFRSWQSIESTGRGGADDGFDVRAFEVASSIEVDDDEESPDERPNPMEGNLWMIQCKREKQLGPKRVEDIVQDAVDPSNPLYGFILAAPAHFSKLAHDKFRAMLRERGVMEFYLWGAGELEDMLYQPKNDHILFAFFGISLTSRRRSRTTAIRTAVAVKNKLMRVLGNEPRYKSILVRDLQDTHYPYEKEYRDFEKRPRWKQYTAVGFHPLGLIVEIERHYAFLDREESTWDVTRAVNLIRTPNQDRQNDDEGLGDSVKSFWEKLPHGTRVTYINNALIRFGSIALVDEKGDSVFGDPHLFVEFHPELGPFHGWLEHLEINANHDELLDGLTRAKIFPEQFPKAVFATIHRDRTVPVDDLTRAFLNPGQSVTLYDGKDGLGFLAPDDAIAVEGVRDRENKPVFLKITRTWSSKGKALLDYVGRNPQLKEGIERQLGRALTVKSDIRIVEALVLHNWQVELNRPVL